MRIQVWDPFIRTFHWVTVIIFFTNYWLLEDGPIHRFLGYVLAGLLAWRMLWGVIGSPHARFADFIPSPHKVFKYIQTIKRGVHPDSLGHNPVGAIMIFTLLILLILVSITGWMIGWDIFWGVDWVEEMHEVLATLTHFFVIIHVSAIVLADTIFRHGLIRAMVFGYKER